MSEEFEKSITIGSRMIPVGISGLKILEDFTQVRLCGVFNVWLGHTPDNLLLGILKSFDILDILVRKGWADSDYTATSGLFQKGVLIIMDEEMGIYSLDYTIGIKD